MPYGRSVKKPRKVKKARPTGPQGLPTQRTSTQQKVKPAKPVASNRRGGVGRGADTITGPVKAVVRVRTGKTRPDGTHATKKRTVKFASIDKWKAHDARRRAAREHRDTLRAQAAGPADERGLAQPKTQAEENRRLLEPAKPRKLTTRQVARIDKKVHRRNARHIKIDNQEIRTAGTASRASSQEAYGDAAAKKVAKQDPELGRDLRDVSKETRRAVGEAVVKEKDEGTYGGKRRDALREAVREEGTEKRLARERSKGGVGQVVKNLKHDVEDAVKNMPAALQALKADPVKTIYEGVKESPVVDVARGDFKAAGRELFLHPTSAVDFLPGAVVAGRVTQKVKYRKGRNGARRLATARRRAPLVVKTQKGTPGKRRVQAQKATGARAKTAARKAAAPKTRQTVQATRGKVDEPIRIRRIYSRDPLVRTVQKGKDKAARAVRGDNAATKKTTKTMGTRRGKVRRANRLAEKHQGRKVGARKGANLNRETDVNLGITETERARANADDMTKLTGDGTRHGLRKRGETELKEMDGDRDFATLVTLVAGETRFVDPDSDPKKVIAELEASVRARRQHVRDGNPSPTAVRSLDDARHAVASATPERIRRALEKKQRLLEIDAEQTGRSIDYRALDPKAARIRKNRQYAASQGVRWREKGEPIPEKIDTDEEVDLSPEDRAELDSVVEKIPALERQLDELDTTLIPEVQTKLDYEPPKRRDVDTVAAPTPKGGRKHRLDFEPGGDIGGHGILHRDGRVQTSSEKIAVPRGAKAFSIDPDGLLQGNITARDRGAISAVDSRLKIGGWSVPRGRGRFEDKPKDLDRTDGERTELVRHADPEWVTERDEALSRLQRQRVDIERELILQRGRFAALMENRHKRGTETRTSHAGRAGFYDADGRLVTDDKLDDVADQVVYLDMGDVEQSTDRAMATPDVAHGYTGRSLLEGDLREHGPRTTQLRNERALGIAGLARDFLRHAVAAPGGRPLSEAGARKVAADQGKGWVIVRVGRMIGAEPRETAIRLDDGDVATGDGYVAMPEGMAKFWQAQMDEPGRALAAGQAATRAFVRAALPLAASWHAGNVADLSLRLAVSGIKPGDIGNADTFRAQLADLDPDLARIIVDSQTGVHSGSRDTVEARGLRDVVHSGREKRRESEGEVVADARPVKDGRLTRVGETLHQRTRKPAQLYDATIGKLADKGFNLGSDIEQRLMRGAQGVALRQLADDLGMAATDAQQIAKRMQKDPELVDDFQRRVLEIVGDYLTRGPRDRKWLHVASPFFQWVKAANRFVWLTLPARHPVKVALYLQAARATEEERRLLGMSDWISDEEAKRFSYPEKQDSFFDGALTFGDSWLVPTSFMTSFGTAAQFAADPIDAMATQVLPQVSKTIGAALGMNGGAVKGATRRVRKLAGEDRAMVGQNTKPSATKAVRNLANARIPGSKQITEAVDPTGIHGDFGVGAAAEATGRVPQSQIEQALSAALGLGRKLPNGDEPMPVVSGSNFRNIDSGDGRQMVVDLQTGEFLETKAPVTDPELRRRVRIAPAQRGRQRVRRLTKDHR